MIVREIAFGWDQSYNILGAKGVARHVCEMVGRHGVGRREFGSCSVSKGLRVMSECSEHTNAPAVRKSSKAMSIALWRHECYAWKHEFYAAVYTTKLYTKFYVVYQPDRPTQSVSL